MLSQLLNAINLGETTELPVRLLPCVPSKREGAMMLKFSKRANSSATLLVIIKFNWNSSPTGLGTEVPRVL